uniref:Uncharacterized protein n=1 Tax=Glossina austeni TaxID=7395 RepID=A0A1A9VJB6_GLOAU
MKKKIITFNECQPLDGRGFFRYYIHICNFTTFMWTFMECQQHPEGSLKNGGNTTICNLDMTETQIAFHFPRMALRSRGNNAFTFIEAFQHQCSVKTVINRPELISLSVFLGALEACSPCVVCLVSFTGDLSLKINVNKLIRNIEMANAELTKPTQPPAPTRNE